MAFKRRFRRKAKVSKAVKKYVKKEIADYPELKQAQKTLNLEEPPFNIAVDNTIASTTHLLLNGMAQGDDEGQRAAQQIVMRQIEFNLYCRSTDETNDGGILRVMLVLDNDANGTVPQWIQLLNSAITGTLPVSTLNIESTNHLVSRGLVKNAKSYTILYDKIHKVYNGGGATDQFMPTFVKVLKRLNKRVQYSGSADDITQILKNSLYFVAWSNVDVQITDFSYRLLYTDA